jgi:predicted transcriptional regulator
LEGLGYSPEQLKEPERISPEHRQSQQIQSLKSKQEKLKQRLDQLKANQLEKSKENEKFLKTIEDNQEELKKRANECLLMTKMVNHNMEN